MRPQPQEKLRLTKCTYCNATFPAEHHALLITHIQWHVEEEAVKRRRKLICRQRRRRGRKYCDHEFATPKELAAHHHKKHAMTFWVEEASQQYQLAEQQAKEEKDELIKHISKQEETPNWLFFPTNGPK